MRPIVIYSIYMSILSFFASWSIVGFVPVVFSLRSTEGYRSIGGENHGQTNPQEGRRRSYSIPFGQCNGIADPQNSRNR